MFQCKECTKLINQPHSLCTACGMKKCFAIYEEVRNVESGLNLKQLKENIPKPKQIEKSPVIAGWITYMFIDVK